MDKVGTRVPETVADPVVDAPLVIDGNADDVEVGNRMFPVGKETVGITDIDANALLLEAETDEESEALALDTSTPVVTAMIVTSRPAAPTPIH